MRNVPAREPEVEHLGAPFVGDDDVRGLEVAMRHAVAMCVRQRVGDLNPISQNRFHRKPCGRDDVSEPLPVDIFHHDVGLAVGGPTS